MQALRRAKGMRFISHWTMVLTDQALAFACVMLAFLIRFRFDDHASPTAFLLFYIQITPLITLSRVLIYHWFGLYRQVWSLASLPEMLRVMAAVTVETSFSATMLLVSGVGFPRSVIIIGWLLKMMALVGVRVVFRLLHEWRQAHAAGRGQVLPVRPVSPNQTRALVFGAGAAGAALVRELVRHAEIKIDIIGFIDDAPPKQGKVVAGRPVLGTRHELAHLCGEHDIKQLIIAVPSINGRVIREVSAAARQLGLMVKTVPGLYEIIDGRLSVTQLRDVQIEDLLGRPEVELDLPAIAGYLTDQIVLVTGAGGSIGSEICRQVARFGPRRLLLLGHGENSIYDIETELARTSPTIEAVALIADIQDEARIDGIFSMFRPDVVFHAAAHKHVPLMELNPGEAVKNNVFGTLNVAQCADRHGVRRFVMLSTDKAVNPTSVMGASKATAEQIVRTYAASSQTAFVTVRFGNVLGSRGSVVPLFRQQIASGGPVTVTDPRMTRYFMTIPEAAKLVIQAGAMGQGGEVFILDMGEPVLIDALARDMIRLIGFEPDEDIAVVYTGPRPGEKLTEELTGAAESVIPTSHAKIALARDDTHSISRADLEAMLGGLREVAASAHDRARVRESIVNLANERGRTAGVSD